MGAAFVRINRQCIKMFCKLVNSRFRFFKEANSHAKTVFSKVCIAGHDEKSSGPPRS